MKKTVAAVLMISLLGGCKTIDTYKVKWKEVREESRIREEKSAIESETKRLAAIEARKPKKYMDANPKVGDQNFQGKTARTISVGTHNKTNRKFACFGDPSVSSVENVEVGYFTMRMDDGWLDHATNSVLVDEKFEFLNSKSGSPFNQNALLNLKKACFADGNLTKRTQVAENKRKAAEAQAIKDRPKVAEQIKREFIKLTGKKNITTYSSVISMAEVEYFVKKGQIVKGTYIKIGCNAVCDSVQYRMTQPTGYGYLLSFREVKNNRWASGSGIPILFHTKRDIFKGHKIEGTVQYIQYAGLDTYISLGGNKQALKIKEIK